MSKVVIIMGSKVDLDWENQIVKFLERFNITSVLRIKKSLFTF